MFLQVDHYLVDQGPWCFLVPSLRKELPYQSPCPLLVVLEVQVILFLPLLHVFLPPLVVLVGREFLAILVGQHFRPYPKAL